MQPSDVSEHTWGLFSALSTPPGAAISSCDFLIHILQQGALLPSPPASLQHTRKALASGLCTCCSFAQNSVPRASVGLILSSLRGLLATAVPYLPVLTCLPSFLDLFFISISQHLTYTFLFTSALYCLPPHLRIRPGGHRCYSSVFVLHLES